VPTLDLRSYNPALRILIDKLIAYENSRYQVEVQRIERDETTNSWICNFNYYYKGKYRKRYVRRTNLYDLLEVLLVHLGRLRKR